MTIHIAVGLDVNSTRKVNLKHDNYVQLSSELKGLYPNFLFEIVPIVLGVTGLVTSDLWETEKLGMTNINDMLAKCQQMALLGTMKIIKFVMRMKNDWQIVIKNLQFNKLSGFISGEKDVLFSVGLSLECQCAFLSYCPFYEMPLVKLNHILTEITEQTVVIFILISTLFSGS